MKITFGRNEGDIRLLAIFLAQLVREGIAFRIDETSTIVTVELTGGY